MARTPVSNGLPAGAQTAAPEWSSVVEHPPKGR